MFTIALVNVGNEDKEVVLNAVQQYGRALKFASEELCNDKEVVLNAIQQDEWALAYVSKELQDDKEIALTALQNGSDVFIHVSPRLKQDQEVRKAAGLEPDIDTVLGDAKKWCQEHNDAPTVQPQHNIER